MRRLLLTAIAAAAFLPLAAHASVQCAFSDISLTIAGTTYNPTACATDVQTGPNNPTAETAALNTAFGGGLTFLAKDDGTTATLNGIKFALDTPTGTTWTMQWTDTNGAAPANLPLVLDFAVLINGGNNGDAYFFNDVTLPAPPNNSGSGAFTITFQNVNGTNIPGLSHMIVAGTVCGDCTPGTTGNPVPEPMTLSLLGAGILGLAAARKRR